MGDAKFGCNLLQTRIFTDKMGFHSVTPQFSTKEFVNDKHHPITPKSLL